jgi:ammonia channel protein AmtB
LQRHIDYVWVLLTGVLVFWMQAGFALLESALRGRRTPSTAR